MKPYKIITLPSPILRKKSKEVTKIDNNIKNIAERMLFTLKESELGLGLAAPQIGENIRIIAVGVNEARDKQGKIIQKEIPLTIFINPEITKLSKTKDIEEEGCLCLLGYYGPVERPTKIKFKALTLDGREIKVNASGLFARIVQHEVDHLEGVLFVDRLTDKSKLRKVKIEADDS